MKKIKLTALLAFMTLGFSTMFAQINETPFPNLQEVKLSAEDMQQFKRAKEVQLNKKLVVSTWYNYISSLDDNGETFTYFSDTHLWPDSLPVLVYATGANHVNIHAIGAVFDPKSLYFLDPTPALYQHNPYTIDSIAFDYKYINLNGITDTLLVQFYGNDRIANLSFGGPSGTPSRSVVLNRALSIGQSATSQVKIPLNMSNNTPGFFESGTSKFSGTIQIATPSLLSIPKNGLGAFTATFLPGNYPAAYGDTLAYNDSTQIPFKKSNSFLPLVFRGDGVASNQDPAFNLGLFTFSSQKYSTTTARPTEWFYPANAPGNNRQYLVSAFHITCNNVGINEVSKVLRVYPNPTAAGDNITFEGVNGSFEYVITDVSGRIINQGNGDSGIIHTSVGMATGTYFLQVTSKETTYKSTVVIQ